MRRMRLVGAVGFAVTVVGGLGLWAAVAPAQAATGTPLPAHVFAPYFESWTGDNPATLSQQSGARYLTMAFLQTASAGSCTPVWNGDASMPVASSTFGSQIVSIRAAGGDVIPSFGGFTADDTGTEIADSCTSVPSIAAAYESVVTTYNVTRLDLDTEDNSLTNSAGIDRRNKAIKMVEDWAAKQGRTVQFSYTLPTTTSGLAASGLAVLQNAVSNNARIDVVNIMTFDYYDNASHEMANDTKSAANGLHGQLQTLYPGTSSAALWARIGVTEMVGIDDFGPPETFTTSDAPTVESWAKSTGIAELSFWALQRDNGGCPGTKGSDSCSGVAQSTWQFSKAFEPFTGGTGPTPSPTHTPSPSPTRSPSPSPRPSSPAPGSCTAPPWSASAVYVGGNTVSYQGHTWQAQWWTQGETPGTSAVWQDNGPCGSQPPPSPGACAQPAWQATRAYTGGSVVSYHGHKWTAKWWTQGDTPGNNSQDVWTDNGPC